jgi:hypothetical protein
MFPLGYSDINVTFTGSGDIYWSGPRGPSINDPANANVFSYSGARQQPTGYPYQLLYINILPESGDSPILYYAVNGIVDGGEQFSTAIQLSPGDIVSVGITAATASQGTIVLNDGQTGVDVAYFNYNFF